MTSNDLALGRARFVMGKQFAGRAAAKFFKFFGQLTRDAKLSIRHDLDASFQCFGQAIGRLEINRRFFARRQRLVTRARDARF